MRIHYVMMMKQSVVMHLIYNNEDLKCNKCKEENCKLSHKGHLCGGQHDCKNECQIEGFCHIESFVEQEEKVYTSELGEEIHYKKKKK